MIHFSRLNFLILFLFSFYAHAQWPKIVTGKDGEKVTVYQFQPEAVTGNDVSGRCPFSVQYKSTDDYIFGVFWFDAVVTTDSKTNISTLVSLYISDMKLPDVKDTTEITKLKNLLETEIPKLNISGSMDDVYKAIDEEQKNTNTSFNNKPPVIYFKTSPTILVMIDGEPKLEDDKELKLKRVINTAYLLVQDPASSKYYLYGGNSWYVSSSLKEGYVAATKLPDPIAALDKQLKSEDKTNQSSSEGQKGTPDILISTVPAELIQTSGEADFASISGTSLLYVSNSEDDIFKYINDQNYYILLSGRWYISPKLDGVWENVAADKLPADFKKIPKGSEKDNVLVSVAGTDVSEDAVKEAQVPQTAKVNRDSVSCTVKYDGTPAFEKIEGTSLELAKNTSSTVIKSGKSYYVLENGIWFISSKATGPWKVSDDRPKDLDKIPPSSPAYNTQYVYIYETTPQVVYVGYTPAYMGCYVYGGTVVYGTGYYYNPWYGPYYYPMPMTYGYCMHYNPYMGWSMGFHCYVYHAAYFGPRMYRPPYYAHYHGGMYGPHGPTYINHTTNININNSNNIYNRQNGVNTNDVKRGNYSKPGNMNQGNGSNQRRQTTVMQQPAGGAGNNNRAGTSQQPAGGGNRTGAGASQQPAGGGNRTGGGASGGGGNRAGAGASQQPAGGGNRGGGYGGGDGGFGGRGGFGGGGGNMGGGMGGGMRGGGGRR